MKNIVEVLDVSKQYTNGTKALKGVTFNLTNGIVGLIGANGAGKSTLMKILVTLVKPTAGKVNIYGRDVVDEKKTLRGEIGYLPQDLTLYEKLTVEESLRYFSALKNLQDDNQVIELMEKLNLEDYRGKKIGELSGGTKRRVGVAQALLGYPSILVLDEPTVGLDPEERVRLHEILEHYASDDRLIILSTHLIEDISKLCKNIVVLKQGQLIYAGSVEAKLKEIKDKVKIVNIQEIIRRECKSNVCILEEYSDENGKRLKVIDNFGNLAGKMVEPTLEDVYLYMMGGKHEKYM